VKRKTIALGLFLLLAPARGGNYKRLLLLWVKGILSYLLLWEFIYSLMESDSCWLGHIILESIKYVGVFFNHQPTTTTTTSTSRLLTQKVLAIGSRMLKKLVSLFSLSFVPNSQGATL
jgi:hypothetical protein